MANRDPHPRSKHGPRPRPDGSGRAAATLPAPDDDPDDAFARWLGERLRRVALGATAALLVARAFWASEPDLRVEGGGGLTWVFALLVVAGLGVASALVSGTFRVRWSWADLGVVMLALCVGASAHDAMDRRTAINLAWEWGGFAVAYLLLRNLPRTRGETSALLAALAATAVSVSVYGLYQVGIEFPFNKVWYLAHRDEALRIVGITPGTAAQALYENRLLGSNEPYSTFALANSLAGFLLGPLVIGLALAWETLTRPGDRERSRFIAVALAAPAALAVLTCLLLTKSRSAYVGLAVAGVVLAWRERRRVPGKVLGLSALAALAVVGALVAGGVATGRLDRQVLTESDKSFGYRLQYWQGAWRVITRAPGALWHGVGPGNFSAPYVLNKAADASEEVQDPHNVFLEVWSTAGVWALGALALAIAFGLANLFGPAKPPGAEPGAADELPPAPDRRPDPSSPPASAGWLVASAAAGWVVVCLLGKLNPFEGELFFRWLVLGVAWASALASGLALWKGRAPSAPAVGAAVLAVLVNLLAAGGIGIAAVALAFWGMLALGMNLRDDRPCGRLRGAGGRVGAFAVAAAWVAALGTFVGAVTPYWKVEAAMADAQDALEARPPAYDRAESAYDRALDADRFSARPWFAQAALEYQVWLSRGAGPADKRWGMVPILMEKGVEAPRAANQWARHRECAVMTLMILKRIGDKLPPMELNRYRANVVKASRAATLLYPTNASLHARLAEASADIGMVPDALKEGREALRLDKLTPHADKKLEPAVRVWIESRLPDWQASVDAAKDAPAGGISGTVKSP